MISCQKTFMTFMTHNVQNIITVWSCHKIVGCQELSRQNRTKFVRFVIESLNYSTPRSTFNLSQLFSPTVHDNLAYFRLSKNSRDVKVVMRVRRTNQSKTWNTEQIMYQSRDPLPPSYRKRLRWHIANDSNFVILTTGSLSNKIEMRRFGRNTQFCISQLAGGVWGCSTGGGGGG